MRILDNWYGRVGVRYVAPIPKSPINPPLQMITDNADA